jgi:hypothetical protein
VALRTLLFIFSACLLLASGTAGCQTAKDYVVTVQRSGAIQFRDSTTLEIVSSINVDLPVNSSGLNGVSVDPSGRTLYIEGPEHTNPTGTGGCCWLYSIEMASAHAKVAAGIWGTKSRRRFVNAGPSLLTTVSDQASVATQVENDEWRISPDGRWWAGLRRGPSLDLYDATRNKIVKSLTVEHGNNEWYLNGAWIKDQFYFYTVHDGSGWLWHVSPESDSLEEAIAVPGPGSVQGCENQTALTEMSAVADRLVVNEVFGGKMDRRQRCDGVTGGAWIIDPASHQSVMTLTPQFYFWRLIPSQDGTSLYGVTSEAPTVGSPSQLVYLDARSGQILRTRALTHDYWWIAVSNLRSIPSGDKSLALPVELTK